MDLLNEYFDPKISNSKKSTIRILPPKTKEDPIIDMAILADLFYMKIIKQARRKVKRKDKLKKILSIS
jgi:hypothetical protein